MNTCNMKMYMNIFWKNFPPIDFQWTQFSGCFFSSLCNIPDFVCSCMRTQDRISWHPSSPPPPPWPRAGCVWASPGVTTAGSPSPPASTQGSWPPYSPPGARAGSGGWPLSGPPARTGTASRISDFGPWNYDLVYLQRLWSEANSGLQFHSCHKGPVAGSLLSTVCLLLGLLIINLFPTHPPCLHFFCLIRKT